MYNAFSRTILSLRTCLFLQLAGLDSSDSDSDRSITTEGKQLTGTSNSLCVEPTLPHGSCRDRSAEEIELSGGILHPGRESCSSCDQENEEGVKSDSKPAKVCTSGRRGQSSDYHISRHV